jgi:UDP-N-acetylenolpyruvoylglucosamine reductase
MSQTKHHADKRAALRQQGVLNPYPQAVTDPLFHRCEFFDPRDVVQVKYEMLRRVHIEKQSVSQATAASGFSRPVFYQAQAALARHGLFGLVPQKRGPRRAHKLTPAILSFLHKTRTAEASVLSRDLAQRVKKRFGVQLHPRSIERGLRAGKKKRR